MNIVDTGLPGVLILEPRVFGDARGFFVETFREQWLRQAGIGPGFVQDNHSRSHRGVLRGLHYQLAPAQGKLVRVSRGSVFSVAVDLRRGSPHFARWTGVVLDDLSHRQLYVPPGFAHGFCVLSDEADFSYKCSTYYCPESEAGIRWDDARIGVQWPRPGRDFLLSDKDRRLPLLAEQLQLPEYAA